MYGNIEGLHIVNLYRVTSMLKLKINVIMVSKNCPIIGFPLQQYDLLKTTLKYLKVRVILAGHIVAMVTCYIKRMTATCLPTIRD